MAMTGLPSTEISWKIFPQETQRWLLAHQATRRQTMLVPLARTNPRILKTSQSSTKTNWATLKLILATKCGSGFRREQGGEDGEEQRRRIGFRTSLLNSRLTCNSRPGVFQTLCFSLPFFCYPFRFLFFPVVGDEACERAPQIAQAPSLRVHD